MRSLKPSFRKEMLGELASVTRNLQSVVSAILRIAAPRERAHQTLMNDLKRQESMNTKTSKQGLPTFLLDYIQNESSKGSILS